MLIATRKKVRVHRMTNIDGYLAPSVSSVKGSLLVVQGLCVVWLVLVVLSSCVLGGCEAAEG
jgi:hypothetical protein